jgi:hypothetical protein
MTTITPLFLANITAGRREEEGRAKEKGREGGKGTCRNANWGFLNPSNCTLRRDCFSENIMDGVGIAVTNEELD